MDEQAAVSERAVGERAAVGAVGPVVVGAVVVGIGLLHAVQIQNHCPMMLHQQAPS